VIIGGIAQGLLYSHRHSRLRVVHRDLKAGNILLDQDMNPKISDCGLPRIFSSNDSNILLNVVSIHVFVNFVTTQYFVRSEDSNMLS
jgi:serine/threonine protein kinase